MIVAIDAGHGGADPGAIGPTGLHEADVNLRIAKELQKLLVAGGVGVLMIRGSNVTMSLKDRTDKANAAHVDLYVAIHCDAALARDAHGFSVFTSPGQTKSDELATFVYNSLSRRLVGWKGMTGRPDMRDGDPDQEQRFWVLVHTKMPAMLSENGFVSNPTQEAFMKSQAFVEEIAKAHFEGIMSYINSKTSA